MKTLFTALGGALVLTENAGVLTLTLDGSLGGGAAAGVITGSGSIVLNGTTALTLAQNLLNANLPASLLPLATVIEGIVDQAVKAIE